MMSEMTQRNTQNSQFPLCLLLSSLVASSGFMMTGCTEGQFFSARSQKEAPSIAVQQAAHASGSGSSVWIKRTDGGVSCEQDKAQSVEQGKDELVRAGIQVQDSRKATDGKMHAQMCGAPTGSENRYLVTKDQFEKAKALGFTEAPKSE
ncbi:MAG: hypothetical protein H7222_14770 [Methylotenera sp.]|nr:hypothetical protein [Oligoflexia bacterium]